MPKRILFLTLLNDVGSDRIVAAMGQMGCECAVIGPVDAFAAHSRFAGVHVSLPRLGGSWTRSLRLGAKLEAVTRSWRPDLIIPLDDASARTLRGKRLFARASEEVRHLLQRSLGDPAHYATVCSREKLVAAAATAGIRTPRQEPVASLADAKRIAAALGYPVVLKREQTCGGFGVAIVRDDAALAEAFRQARRKAATKHALQSLLGLETADQNTLALQEYISGPMAFRVVACAGGKVLDGISFVAECIHPPVTGASTVLRPIARPDMDKTARTLVAKLGCSGLVSLDFILSADGACLIELNPRPVASGHLGSLYGHDIYESLIAHFQGVPATRPASLTGGPERIALFPRELDRDPRGTLLATSSAMLHDIPLHDDGLIARYTVWLERRHPDDREGLRQRLMPGADVLARPRKRSSTHRSNDAGSERRPADGSGLSRAMAVSS